MFRNRRIVIRRQSAGFTLVEIMMVVSMIGLLAALAIPSFQWARSKAALTRIANDLRVFSDAFQQYCMVEGLYPVDTHNILPPGMEAYIKQDKWNADALGGNYNWEGPSWGKGGSYAYAGISLFSTTANSETLKKLDTMIDNGDLATGSFRQTPNRRYTYIIEEP